MAAAGNIIRAAGSGGEGLQGEGKSCCLELIGSNIAESGFWVVGFTKDMCQSDLAK